MTSPSLQPVAAAGAVPSPWFQPGGTALTQRQLDFASTLARSQSHPASGSSATTAEDAARQAAQDFVALALVQPLLTHLRGTNHAAPPFKPTNGERQFQSIADAHLARQIVRSTRFPVVDRLARDLLAHARAASASGPIPAAPAPPPPSPSPEPAA